MGKNMGNTAEHHYDLLEAHYDNSKSMRENARLLNSISPIKTIKGWEMVIYRWKKNNKKPAPKPAERFEFAEESVSMNKSYHYDEIHDVYYTFLSIADQMIAVEGEKHRGMKEAYSNMVGKGASMNEITRDFGIPRAWFDEYRRRHGWTHDMSPYSDEEIATGDIDQLVEDLVLRKKQLLHQNTDGIVLEISQLKYLRVC